MPSPAGAPEGAAAAEGTDTAGDPCARAIPRRSPSALVADVEIEQEQPVGIAAVTLDEMQKDELVRGLIAVIGGRDPDAPEAATGTDRAGRRCGGGGDAS